jgi:hypothetical protein
VVPKEIMGKLLLCYVMSLHISRLSRRQAEGNPQGTPERNSHPCSFQSVRVVSGKHDVCIANIYRLLPKFLLSVFY